MSHAELPPFELLREQAAWLAPARQRLLRRAGIARRRRVLDLACGRGAVTGELVRRSGGTVLALDRSLSALRGEPQPFRGAGRVCAEAARLPLAAASMDLVFCQFALMWLDVAAAAAEIHRVLRPGGVLAALEPDCGGMIEHPPELATAEIWIAALARAGANPLVGRKLPGVLAAAGFRVHVGLLDRLEPPSPLRFDLLAGLPLSSAERHRLDNARQADAACPAAERVVHLPIFLITAQR